MSLMTRAIATITLLTAAAIPVAALTIKNSSSQDVKVAVDNGSAEGVYTVPAGGSVDVTEDCSSDCAVTGPWGYSRLVSQNATIETDGTALVTVGTAAPAPALVPQNPVAEPSAPAEIAAPEAPAAAEAPAAEAPAAAPAPVPQKQAYKPRRKAKQAKTVKKSGPGAGTFQMLFYGPGK